jgi:hypothetical protein
MLPLRQRCTPRPALLIPLAALTFAPAAGCALIIGLQDPTLDNNLCPDYALGYTVECDAGGGAGGSGTVASSSSSSVSTTSTSTSGTGGAAPIEGKTLLGGLTNPNSLAVDNENVYWTDGDDGTVMQADLATATPKQFAGGLMGPQSLSIQLTNLGTLSRLAWVEPSAGNVDTSGMPPQVGFQAAPYAVAQSLSGGPIFWTTTGAGETAPGLWTYAFTQIELTTFTVPGGKLAVGPSGSAGCYTVVYAMGATLWTAGASGSGASCASSTMLFSGVDIAGVALDATSAYWTTGTAGTVALVSLSGGTPTIVSPSEATPTDIAVDATDVYWLDQGASAGSGTVMRAPLAGGTPAIVASGQVTPRGLFVTTTDIYWIAGAKDQGVIKTLAK